MPSLLQTKQWADFKVSQGWQSYEIANIFVLEKKLFLGKSFLYTPEVNFAEIDSERSRRMNDFLQKIKEISQKSNSIFFRLEILDEFDENLPDGEAGIIEKLKENGFIKSFEEVQPEYRQIIDITKSEDEILAQMKEKGRYNIRVAEKHNVVIEKSDPSTSPDYARDKSLGVNDFYQIFRETAKRDGFEIRPQKYFDELLKKFAPNNAELLVALYHHKPIAAEIITYYDQTATYLYGASSNEDRQVMAPYLLHWQAIKNAKEKGCKYYDLLAVNPEGVENHRFAGIGRFKRQFGGKTVQIVGSWDLVYKPTYYKMFKMAEKLRRR